MASKESSERTRQDYTDILDRAAAAKGDIAKMPSIEEIRDAAEALRPLHIPNPVDKIKIVKGARQMTKPVLEQLSKDCKEISNHVKAEDEAKRQKKVLMDALNDASPPEDGDSGDTKDNKASREVDPPSTARRL